MTKDDLVSKDTALKMAIEALETADAIVTEYSGVQLEAIQPAINACKEALKQPAQLSGNSEQLKQEPVAWLEEMQGITQQEYYQEPVAWMNDIAYSDEIDNLPANRGEIIPLYSNPHQWVGLTDDEIQNITWKIWGADALEPELDYARAIELALKDKNT